MPGAAEHVRALTNLTEPRLLTFDEAVGEMASASGQPLSYVPVSFEQYANMLGEHFSAQEIPFFIEPFRYLLDGHSAHTTDGVEQMLGRPARDFRSYAQDAAGAWRL